MKKLLLCLVLTCCGYSNGLNSAETMPPLVTTGHQSKTTQVNLRVNPSSIDAFVRNFYDNYLGFKSMSRDDIIGSGKYFCNLMRSGMTSREIARDIRLSSASEQEREMMLSILANAILDLCPVTL